MKLSSCHCCGLVQQVPTLQPRQRPLCCRCGTPLGHGTRRRNELAAALAAAALAFYPPAVLLPMMSIEKLGHRHEDSLLSGLAALLGEGYWFVGIVVLLFSVLLPPLKLLLLLLLSRPRLFRTHRQRALLYRSVEFLGRWGMLDVMLVSILVAFVKLGDLISIHAGPGLAAFALLVLSSLVAGLIFNPHAMWEGESESLPEKPLSLETQGTVGGSVE